MVEAGPIASFVWSLNWNCPTPFASVVMVSFWKTASPLFSVRSSASSLPVTTVVTAVAEPMSSVAPTAWRAHVMAASATSATEMRCARDVMMSILRDEDERETRRPT
jgi:hypothetical protein